MKKYSKKRQEERKKEREGFPEFYQKHIQFIKDNKVCCQECDSRLKGDSSEVCHILPKGRFKSVSTNDLNIIYLCGWTSINNCHSKFDNGTNEDVKNMKIFCEIENKFLSLREIITESINYKVTDRYIK